MELTTTTQKEHLINFLDAFETDPCSDIIQLKEDKKNIYQSFIWELHQEESPNNWRYNTIFYLLDSVVNQYDFETIEDNIHEIVESQVDIYNYNLATWLSDDISRGCIDLHIDIEGNKNVFDYIRAMQYEIIFDMLTMILNKDYSELFQEDNK